MHQQVNALVTTALRQSRLSGLSEMLKSVAEAMKAHGAILWQVASGSEIEARRGHLQVLAEWFPKDQSSALYTLPLAGSLTGEALATQRALSTKDLADPRVYDDPFFTEAGIQTFCSLPLRFVDESWGALNLYRNAPNPFAPGELNVAERLAALVPQLYQAIRDRVSFDLIHQVHETLNEAEISSPDHPLEIEDVKQILKRICQLVSDAFQCIETSVFLEDRLRTPGVYELAASTWPFPISKRTYSSDPKDGLTGWALAHAKVVNLPNLSRFEEDQPTIQSEYPGLRWNDPLDLEQSVRSLWPNLARGWLPLSFMAVPIMRGERVFGVIRCSVAGRCPYSFAGHEQDLLALVAAQVARFWGSWLGRREIDEENRTWKTLVESIQKLNRFVLSESEPDEHLIFRESLQVSGSLIAGAEIMDVRLLEEIKDEKGNVRRELFFVETAGDAWHEGTPEMLQLRDRRFPVGKSARPSAGAHVVETGEVYLIPNVNDDPYYWEAFPKTKQMILAPMVSVGDEQTPKVLGVLDIRGTEEREFPRHAKDIAGLLGSQLGLYHGLATTIGKMKRLQREQVQIFQDLKHQLKTPIGQAQKRIGLVLKLPELVPTIEEHLRKVRGLVAKAMRVNMNTGLFASLARGESLKPKISSLTSRDLIKLLIEAGMDNQLMVEARRNINFDVDRSGFEQFGELKVDKELLEQAIYDLLDNAYKYSDSKTVIRILGGPTRGGVQIRIVNTGIPIETYEIPRCVERGWQSEAAKSVSGSGSGIGLWIVDHIMKAHGGELQIMPTRSNRETEIRLLFPPASFR